jgi:hypothetical protein
MSTEAVQFQLTQPRSGSNNFQVAYHKRSQAKNGVLPYHKNEYPLNHHAYSFNHCN